MVVIVLFFVDMVIFLICMGLECSYSCISVWVLKFFSCMVMFDFVMIELMEVVMVVFFFGFVFLIFNGVFVSLVFVVFCMMIWCFLILVFVGISSCVVNVFFVLIVVFVSLVLLSQIEIVDCGVKFVSVMFIVFLVCIVLVLSLSFGLIIGLYVFRLFVGWVVGVCLVCGVEELQMVILVIVVNCVFEIEESVVMWMQ